MILKNVNEINVVLVDDHEIVRKGLSAYLKVTHDIHIVGEASDGNEAVEVCLKTKLKRFVKFVRNCQKQKLLP